MSQPSLETPDVIAQIIHITCIEFAVSALSVWEYVITFASEVDVFWKRRITATSLLFIAARWTLVASTVPNFIPAPKSTQCEALYWATQTLFFMGYIATALFSALRTFAIWRKSYACASLVLVLGMAPVITNLYTGIRTTYGFIPQPVAICTDEVVDISAKDIVVYVTRGSLLAADSIVLIVTWIKTFGNWRMARQLNLQLSLSTCLLRDGTWYFVGLLAINMAQILTYQVISSPVAPFITTLPLILMNRFIINLRTLNAPEVTEPSQRQHFSRFSTPGFRVPQSFLGNIGEHLVHNDNLSFVDTDEERELSTQDSDGEMTSGRDTDQVLSPIAGVSPADGEDFEAFATASFVTAAGPSRLFDQPSTVPSVNNDEYRLARSGLEISEA